MQHKLLSNWQISLLSIGAMIGSGWLFAPYFAFKSVGITGAVIAWVLLTLIATIIAYSFAEVIFILPLSGGMTRFLKVTHGNTITLLLIICGWISYIVLVPLEAQSTIRYLSFWVPTLSQNVNNHIVLSVYGTVAAFVLIIALTYINTLIITKVANANSVATLWKIIIPAFIVIFVILGYGSFSYFMQNLHGHAIVLKDVFNSISQDGLALSLLGFQNGLLLSRQCKDPKKGIIYSLFLPLIIAAVLYIGLSLTFAAVPSSVANTAIAPLLGLISTLGIQWLVIILFMDAVISPLGAGNVYITFASRVLHGIAKEYLPNSKFAKMNMHDQPAYCLWLNALVACIFLMPFPTWSALADFFASIIALMYLSGPIALIALRRNAAAIERPFKVYCYNLVGYLGFTGCGLLIFWSGLKNMEYLTIMLVILFILSILVARNSFRDIMTGALLVVYCGILYLVGEADKFAIITFPYDVITTIVVSLISCHLFARLSNSETVVKSNIKEILQKELA